MNSKRIYYADILRIVAIIGIVILHTSAFYFHKLPVNSLNWQESNIFNSIVHCSVPIFIMLSGMIFLDPDRDITNQKLFTKNIPRIAVALFFWGCLYGIISIIMKHYLEFLPITITEIVNIPLSVIFGPPWYHLWYLYLIIGLYLLTPLFRILVKASKKKDIEYLLGVFFVLGLSITFINGIIAKSNLDYRIYLPLNEVMGFSGYYFAGYYLSKFELDLKKKRLIYFLGFISIAITIIATSILSRNGGTADEFMYEYLYPTTMLVAFAVFIHCRSRYEKKEISEKLRKVIEFVSESAFGIYLTHDFINRVFFSIGLSTESLSPIYAVPLLSLCNLLLSMIIVAIIKRIPILNKWIV